MKYVNCQCMYEVPDSYTYVAFNREGIMCGFQHAPVRDFVNGQWVDSVTGSTGEMILFGRWDVSSREVSILTDMRKNIPRYKQREKLLKDKRQQKENR